MMDVKLINHAFLHGLTVEIWQAGELIGSGKIIEHTRTLYGSIMGIIFLRRVVK